jgi:citrate lyase beta subunit
LELSVDSFILELEDTVAFDKKAFAIETVVEALKVIDGSTHIEDS